jgi:hypothetical protein
MFTILSHKGNANKKIKYTKIPSHTRLAVIKKTNKGDEGE